MNKLFIGSSRDSDVGCGNILTFKESDVLSISRDNDNGWTMITTDGCYYDFTDLQVIEGTFTLRQPLPTDSRS